MDMWRTASDTHSEVMLGDDLHSEVVLLDDDVRTCAHGLHQSSLDLCTSIVGMMKDAKLRVSALTMEIERTIFLAVEVHPPLHQFANLLWCTAHHLLNGLAVADIVACNHCVLDVLLEIVDSQIGHRGHTTLCERSVSLVEACLADKAYASPLLSIL